MSPAVRAAALNNRSLLAAFLARELAIPKLANILSRTEG